MVAEICKNRYNQKKVRKSGGIAHGIEGGEGGFGITYIGRDFGSFRGTSPGLNMLPANGALQKFDWYTILHDAVSIISLEFVDKDKR